MGKNDQNYENILRKVWENCEFVNLEIKFWKLEIIWEIWDILLNEVCKNVNKHFLIRFNWNLGKFFLYIWLNKVSEKLKKNFWIKFTVLRKILTSADKIFSKLTIFVACLEKM